MTLASKNLFLQELRPAGKTRPGFTLIEMSVVSTVSVVLFAIAVSVLITLNKQDVQTGLRLRHTADLSRLADQFRSDVHAAGSIEIPPQDQSSDLKVVCHMPDGSTIEYLRKNKHIIRVTSNPDGEERHERFLFSPDATCSVEKLASRIAEGTPPEPVESERGQLVKLILRWPLPGHPHDKTRELSVVAQTGRDLPVRIKQTGANDATT